MTTEKKTHDQLGETDKFRKMYAKVKPTNGNGPYLVSVILSLLIAVTGSAFIISLRPDYDPIIIIVTIGTATGAVTTQILQFMKLQEVAKTAEIAAVQAIETKVQTELTHQTVNSTLSAALETARKAGYGAGVEAGRAAADLRTDELKAAETKPAE